MQVFHATDGHVISLYRERKAAFWFVGEVAYPDGKTETIHSDTSWEVSRYANRKVYSYPGFIPSVPPSEEVDGEDVLVAVPTSLYHQAPPEQRAFNQFGVRGTYPLTPRPIPHHVKHPQKPMLLVKTDKNGADYDAGQYETAYVHLSVKGKAGTEVRLEPGQSITLWPHQYHEFHVVPGSGSVLIGEVSQCNDDNTDNRFYEPVYRFPEIEEDEPPYRLLCNEYPKAPEL